MKKKLLLICTIYVSSLSFSQRIKTPVKAIDNETYKVGDILKINLPTNNNQYQTIYYTDRTSALEVTGKILDFINRPTINETSKSKTIYADSKIKNFSGPINFFKKEKLQNDEIIYAYIPFNDQIFLKVGLNPAIENGEISSKNKEYKTLKSKENSTSDNIVESFNDSFKIELIGAFGNSIDRKITVEFTIQNNMDLTQLVNINYDGNWAKLVTESFASDFEGNTYKCRETNFGKSKSYGMAENEIPSKIKIKCSITYLDVLTDINKLSLINIKMTNKNAVSNSNYYDVFKGTTSFRNIPVIWNTAELTQENNGKDYSLKLGDKNLLIDIISVIGNIKTQKVLIEYSIVNNSVNANVCISPSFFTDIEGNMYNSNKQTLGQKNNCSLLPTNIKVKGLIELINVPKKIDKIEYLNIPLKNNYTEINNELRNLKINWK